MENEKTAVEVEPQLPEKRKPHKPSVETGRASGGLVPRTFEEMYRMAQILAASGMTPKDMKQPEQVFAALQMGAEIGLSPMQAVQNIAVINGRPSVWGDAMLAIVQGSGLLVDFDESPITDGGKVAGYTCTATRRGWSAPIVRTFTMSDAKAAGLAGKQGPWQTYPSRMLQMRARSWALRDGFADVLKGVMAREEAQDILEGEVTVIDDPFAPGRHEARPKAIAEPEPADDTKPETAASPPDRPAEDNGEAPPATATAQQPGAPRCPDEKPDTQAKKGSPTDMMALMLRNFATAGITTDKEQAEWLQRYCEIKHGQLTRPQLKRVLAVQAEELATDESQIADAEPVGELALPSDEEIAQRFGKNTDADLPSDDDLPF